MKSLRFTALMCILFFFTGLSAQVQKSSPKKILVAFYSHTGNTRAVAEDIRKVTGADIFEIVPVKAYSTEHSAVVDQARKEIEAGVQPELKNALTNFKEYDVIFIGSPCWWATIAPPVATFLASYDFSGITVVPFMTHEGSYMGRSVADIRKLCPKATVEEGLPVRGSKAASSEKDIREWIEKLKLNTK